jgi:glycerol uptake facilitator protein
MDDKNLRSYMAELIGTFAVVFVSAGAVIATRLGGLEPWSVTIALAAGLIYAGALAATLNVSGGYLNPALTVMLWVFRRVDGPKAVGLVFVQLLGATLAGLALRLVFPSQEDVLVATQMGAPHLNLDAFNVTNDTRLVAMLKGIGVELVLTFVLAFAVFALVFDPRSSRWGGPWAVRLTALWLGLIVIAATLLGARLTGAAMNPARWFGPTMTEFTLPALQDRQPFADHAIYWIGPIAGALLAGWVYSSLVLPQEEERVSAPAPVATGSGSAGVSSTLYRARK